MAKKAKKVVKRVIKKTVVKRAVKKTVGKKSVKKAFLPKAPLISAEGSDNPSPAQVDDASAVVPPQDEFGTVA
jgi:hypothetical protein